MNAELKDGTVPENNLQEEELMNLHQQLSNAKHIYFGANESKAQSP